MPGIAAPGATGSGARISPSVLLLFAIVGLIVYYAMTQERISFNGGVPYDAESYYALAQIYAGVQPAIDPLNPFAKRVALPWVVAMLFPDHIIAGFTVINFLFSLAILVVLYHFLFRYVKNRQICLLLMILFIVNPASPFRLGVFYPVMTDPPALFFMLTILYWAGMERQTKVADYLLVSVLSIAGVLFREVVLCSTLVFSAVNMAQLSSHRPYFQFKGVRTVLMAMLPTLCALATLVAIQRFSDGAGAYGYAEHAGAALAHHWNNLAIYPLAWLTAFGPVVIVVLASLRMRTLRWFMAHPELALYGVGIALLSAFAGFHTDRFVFWTYPVVLVLFGRFLLANPLQKAAPAIRLLFFASLLAAQVLAFRVFLDIPDDQSGELPMPGPADYFMLAPYGETTNLGHTYAAYMLPADRVTLLSQYALFAIFALSLLGIASRQARTLSERGC